MSAAKRHGRKATGWKKACYPAAGCRAALVQGDRLVTVPEESQAHKQVVRKAATERAIQINPAARLCYVELPPASLEDERSDWARLADELAVRFGLERNHLRIDFAIPVSYTHLTLPTSDLV